NFAKGISSELSKVVAMWPERKSRAEVQSLNPSPCFSNLSCKLGMAKAPRASTGVSLSSSRRLTCRNFLSSTLVPLTLSLSIFTAVPQIIGFQSVSFGSGRTCSNLTCIQSADMGFTTPLKVSHGAIFTQTEFENHTAFESG